MKAKLKTVLKESEFELLEEKIMKGCYSIKIWKNGYYKGRFEVSKLGDKKVWSLIDALHNTGLGDFKTKSKAIEYLKEGRK